MRTWVRSLLPQRTLKDVPLPTYIPSHTYSQTKPPLHGGISQTYNFYGQPHRPRTILLTAYKHAYSPTHNLQTYSPLPAYLLTILRYNSRIHSASCQQPAAILHVQSQLIASSMSLTANLPTVQHKTETTHHNYSKTQIITYLQSQRTILPHPEQTSAAYLATSRAHFNYTPYA